MKTKPSLTQMFLKAQKEEVRKLEAAKPAAKDHLTVPVQEKKYLEGVWMVRPTEAIPEEFVDVMKTWKACREHPAWKGHPQL